MLTYACTSLARRCFLTSFLFVVVATLLVGCTPEKSPDGASSEEYSGEEMFQGLILAQGEVAEEFEVVQEYWMVRNYVEDEGKLEAYGQFSQKIVDQINAARPEYFSEFEAALTSGDRPAIREALIKGSLVAAEAVGNLEEVQQLRARFREDPDLAQRYLENLREAGAEERTVERTGRLLTAFGTGELGPDVLNRFPEVGAATAVVVAGYVAVAVAAVVAIAAVAVAAGGSGAGIVTNQVVTVNTILITPSRFRDVEPGLLQEQLVDATARRFGPQI